MDFITHYIHNFARNITHTFDNMDMIKWIRLVAIIGAYMMLRPYLEKIGAYLQGKQHEKELDPAEMGVISPNSLRGQVQVPEDSEEEPEAQATSTNWGKKARKRQRQMLRKALEADEKRGREDDEEDRDILDQLVDYEEGKDGW